MTKTSIGSYGFLGDTRTGALVSEQGSIDWLCIPRFDGPPVFGRLIDPEHGGSWTLQPMEARVIERSYEERAASLVTRWKAPRADFVVREGFIADVSAELLPRSALVRRVECVAGEADVETLFDPRLGLPGRPPDRTRRTAGALVCTWGSTALGLAMMPDLHLEPARPCRFTLRTGDAVTFVLSVGKREPLALPDPGHAWDLLERSDDWWRRWSDRFDYGGPHRDAVIRSLITLRLLTYAPSGAPVAAPTTSLPAPVGGDRNWDYRFSWPRDASIGVGAFLGLGSEDEPRAFMEWFVNASRITRPRLDVLYTLDGRPVRYERQIDGIAGHAGSRPVRVGNAAATQHQLDVYGWVLYAGRVMHEAGMSLNRDQWRAMRSFADTLAARWREPDNGIWEVRTPRQHYVHSKVMAWAGLDAGLRLAARYPAGSRAARWRTERDLLARAIQDRGVDPTRGVYVRAFDAADLDASILVAPMVGFEPDGSGPIEQTIHAVRSELGAGGPLLYRYLPSNEAREGAFLPCSFWLVDALARTGRSAEAHEVFDQLCGMASPLGLYAEQIDPTTREHIGNFPQAFTHATLLQSLVALNADQGTRRGSAHKPRARPRR